MLNCNDIEIWIKNWFKSNTVITKEDLGQSSNENYFEKGWMDSFKFISFIMDLEEKFNLSFSNDEFQDRDFSTINGLIKIVNKRLEKQ